jgi:hypothetical protein
VTCLLQLRIFCLGLLQDGDVGIGVQPDHQECCISLTGLFDIATELVGATQLQASKHAERKVCNHSAMVDYLLEFSGSLPSIARSQIRFAADVHRVQRSVRGPLYGLTQFVFGSHTQQFDCFLWVAAIDGNGGADGGQPVSLNQGVAVEFRSDFVSKSRGPYCVTTACKG